MKQVFDSDIAKEYGAESAIILQAISYMADNNKKNNVNLHDGKYWVCLSHDKLQEMFPYFSKNKITTSIHNLIDNCLIVSGTYNKSKYDKTLWYALSDKGIEIIGCNKAKKEDCFRIPSVEEVKAYCAKIDYNIDAQYFIAYYNERDWMSGKYKIKDWKATIRAWKKRNEKKKAEESAPQENGRDASLDGIF